MGGTQSVIQELINRSRVAGLIGPDAWNAVKDALPSNGFDLWLETIELLISAGLGPAAIIGFVQNSPSLARAVGEDAILALARSAILTHEKVGARASATLLDAAPIAAKRLSDPAAFLDWLLAIEEVVLLAPESVVVILSASDKLLSLMDAAEFRAWILQGVRQGGESAERRIAYFLLIDPGAVRAVEQASSDILFPDVERRLKAYLRALWRLRPVIRTAPIRAAGRVVRRLSLDGTFIRIPEAYSGYRGKDALRIFRAALAHAGAHMMFSGAKFPIGTLKPVQIALVSLIEDARVEALAAEEYPGLRRLWSSFHTAEPRNALAAELLMARLARALINPEYRDNDPWVAKGRTMFHDHHSQWDDPGTSRKIGGLLGNDLGQMRVQFNAKTYVVEPPYRDDSQGLWDFGEPPPQESDEAETAIDAVRVEHTEKETDPQHRRRNIDDGAPANRAAQMRAMPENTGVPIAKYPEWDHILGRDRAEWTTIVEFDALPAPTTFIDELLETYSDVELRIAKLIRTAKVSKPARLRRQPEGDRLDVEACIRAMIDYRMDINPDPRVYETTELRGRDLSVLVLLDISESTRENIRGTQTSVISIERAAAALLAQALAELGDPFAIHAFCSNGRDEVRYYRVKDFQKQYDSRAKAHLAGLRGGYSTRMGAALRHAGAEIAKQQTYRRLVLMITDGEPSDIDVTDRKYLVEDARKAVQGLSHQGIDVFCVGLDSGGDSYLARIFGRRNAVQIDRVEALPERLPVLYLRLTT